MIQIIYIFFFSNLGCLSHDNVGDRSVGIELIVKWHVQQCTICFDGEKRLTQRKDSEKEGLEDVCTGGGGGTRGVQEGRNAMNITLTPTPSHNSILSFTSKPSTTLPQIPTLSPLPSSYYR